MIDARVWLQIKRFLVWIVFLLVGIVIGYFMAALFQKDDFLGLVVPVAFFLFCLGLGVGMLSCFSPQCRHKKSSVLERILNATRISKFVFTYQEILAAIIIGLIIGLLRYQVQEYGFVYAQFQEFHVYWVISVMLGFFVGLLPEQGVCVLCGDHRPAGTPSWFKPITNPNHKFVTASCRDAAKERAYMLAEWIKKSENEGGVVLLNGGHGSGKSTFKNLILHFLWETEKGKTVIIEISPWETIGQQGLQQRVLSEILVGVNNHYALGSYKQDWRGLLDSVCKGVPTFAPVSWWANNFSAEGYLEKFRELFQALAHNVVVVLEDLERLEPVELKALLRLVDEMRCFPNLHFLIPIDLESCAAVIGGEGDGKRGVPDLIHRVLPGLTWETHVPDADERTVLLKTRHELLCDLWRARLKKMVMDSGFNIDFSKEELRLENAMSQLGVKLNSFRKINAFSRQIDGFNKNLLTEIDLPDLMLAEATRILDPVGFYRLFTVDSPIYSTLPETYDGFLMHMTLSLKNPDGRKISRSNGVIKILDEVLDYDWFYYVFGDVFGCVIGKKDDATRVLEFPEPNDADRLHGRLKSPSILALYNSQISRQNQSVKEFIDGYEKVSITGVLSLFWSYIQPFRDKHQSTGSDSLRIFISDIILGYSAVFKRNPAKTEAILLSLSSESKGFRDQGDFPFTELMMFERLIWALLCWVPESRRKSIVLEMIAVCSNVMLLPELYRPQNDKQRKSELIRTCLSKTVSEETIQQIISMEGEFKDACSRRAEELFASPDFIDRLVGNPSNIWILDWRVSISEKQEEVQKRNVTDVKNLLTSNDAALIIAFNRYLGAHRGMNNLFSNIFGAEGEKEIMGLLRK